MKFYLLLALGLTISVSYAQSDTTFNRIQHKTDSLIKLSSGQWLEDSLKIDQWGSNLKQKLNAKNYQDSLGIQHKIDSLQRLGQSASHYQKKLDSLLRKKDAFTNEINSKQTDLLQSTKNKVQEWQAKVKNKLGIDSLEVNTGMNVSSQLNLPNVKQISTELNLPALPEMPKLSNANFQSLNFSPDLMKLDMPSFQNPLEGLQSMLQNIERLGKTVTDAGALMKNADKAIESSVMKLDGMKVAQDQIKVADQFKQNEFMTTAEKMKDPEAMKKEMLMKAQEQAINHFAGKEAELKSTMQKISKYKQKYTSVSNLKDLELKKKNVMNGRPFIERVIPGIAIQLQKPGSLLVDFNPYVGYRISGIFTSGLGWNQRYAYDQKQGNIQHQFRMYGPRVYTEAKLWKGFYPRIEAEMMNTYVPPMLTTKLTENSREWIPGLLLGLKKEYRFLKKIKGTALIMFNLYNPHHKSPYQDVANMRFGFEFPMKKAH